MRRSGLVLVLLVCSAFALKALLLLDATSFWKDELYTAAKSFQPSLQDVLRYLREDTHPPVYYALVWFWGKLLPQTSVSLRLFSWITYAVGGLLMVVQAGELAAVQDLANRRRAMGLAAVLAFCTPFPVRFSIEAKGYSLVVLWLAWMVWERARFLALKPSPKQRILRLWLAGALAGLTHFFGLGVVLAVAGWDAMRGRWHLSGIVGFSCLPSGLWVFWAAGHLIKPSTNEWIPPPNWSLLVETLERCLGDSGPLLLVVLGGLVVLIHARFGRNGGGSWAFSFMDLADRSAVAAGGLFVVLVVAISWIRPLAFSRYFVVLVPLVVPWLAVMAAGWQLQSKGSLFALGCFALLIVHFWTASFVDLVPTAKGERREKDDFRALSIEFSEAGQRLAFGSQAKLLNQSDKLLLTSGRLTRVAVPWMDEKSLLRLDSSPLDRLHPLFLASTGAKTSRLEALSQLRKGAEGQGWRCKLVETSSKGTDALVCSAQPTSSD